MVNAEHLARLKVADKLCPDRVERARFRRINIRMLRFAEAERPKPPWVARCNQLPRAHHNKAKRPAQPFHRPCYCLLNRMAHNALLRNNIGNYLRVARRLEDCARVFKLLTQLVRVDNVAVVRHCERSLFIFADKRLGILAQVFTTGRVPHMPYAHRSF